MSSGDDRLVARYPVRLCWYPNDYAKIAGAPSREAYTGAKDMRRLVAAVKLKGSTAWAEVNIGTETVPRWNKLNLQG